MDRQSCPLIFGSYAYTKEEMLYMWKTNAADPSYRAVGLVEGLQLSQFDLINNPYGSETLVMRNGITTVLTLSTFGLDTRTDLPKVPYPTALDWFVIMCFTYVICSLLEFAGVHYFTKVGSGEYFPGVHTYDERDHTIKTIQELEDELEDEEYEDEDEDTPPFSTDEFANSDCFPEGSYTFNKFNSGCKDCDIIRAQSLLDSALRQRTVYDDMPLRVNSASVSNHILASGYSGGRVSSSLPTLAHRCVPYVPAPPPPQRRRLPCLLEFIMCMISHEKYRDELRRSAPKGQFVNSVSQIDKVSRILFPASFFLLNILYWFGYGHYKPPGWQDSFEPTTSAATSTGYNTTISNSLQSTPSLL
ncbi:gamma-aminobutyric acid receptor alpha-like [Tropilaelaps mercedesae]|uniref:Gamma-aminobutyric acid receptor alpha-like n=1 Tax=Tropilaelaps mercedesae TaxID=418985 RepID=A0A1V9XK85_9ACAR|nr:gamma-aminobutyric acid receptor alpha-like [Tropilaelaps mercedesae]